MSVRIMHQKSNIDSFVLLLVNSHYKILSLERKDVWGFFFRSVFEFFLMTPLPAQLW